MKNLIRLDVCEDLGDLEMSDSKRFKLIFHLLSAFDSLKFVKVKLEVFHATRLSEALKGLLHIDEELVLISHVVFFLLLDFDLNDGLELTHELSRVDLARLVLLHLVEDGGKKTGLGAS